MKSPVQAKSDLIRIWSIPYAARLGSSVRSKGIFLEVRSRLPLWARKALAISGGELSLSMPKDAEAEFNSAAMVVTRVLHDIDDLAVLPREIEDILTISTTERHRWLKDGRLPSSGTRTVRLPGRAKKITFHVFDPRVVEELLDSGRIEDWREQDALTAAENRRRAAWNRRLTRSAQAVSTPPGAPDTFDDDERFKLEGWAEFERDGPR